MILGLLLPPALILLVGLASALLSRAPRAAHAVGAAGICTASLAGLAAVIAALVTGDTTALTLPWNPAIGASFSIAFDPLTGFFLLPIYGLSAVCAVFGGGYLSPARHGRNTAAHIPRNTAAHWLFYALLVASMAMVVLARNAVLFLVAWEVMSLSSWQLVTFEHEREETRQAGITYLVATQIGTAFLLVMFLVLGGAGSSSLDFANLGAHGATASAVFLLALVGFGTKAGIVPLHVWLPEAHPAAPSHVSALMSGVMIKTGIYGIVRMLAFIGNPPSWWGWTLVSIGAVSGIMGVLFALAQHDIKRLLAYHSVENIGIICLGLGVGLLGISFGAPVVAFLGFAGGLLHVLNHALFKGLLFLGAGAASQAAGTREIDRLGGLLKRMPLTGAAFVVGAAAICGLPPLNGFVSELLVFLGAFNAAATGAAASAAAAGIVVTALALIGGLAAACFTKAFGISFLGEPRTAAAAAAHEAGGWMVAPLVVLAAGCAAVGLLGPLAVSFLAPLASALSGTDPAVAASFLERTRAGFVQVTIAAGVLASLVTVLVILRAALQSRRAVRRAGTWDCGYTLPDARMQYTASSFAQPLVGMFRFPLATRRHWAPIRALFPEKADFSSHTPDAFAEGVFRPAFAGIGALLSRLRWLQHGRLQLYVLYVAATLLVLLVWKLGGVMVGTFVQVCAALVLAPMLPGIVNRVKAVAAGRKGSPILQTWFDIAKLLGKSAVYSRTTGWVFRMGPVVGLSAAAAALVLLPWAGSPTVLFFDGDLLLFAGLLAVMRFVTIIAALDTGSAFEGMGASREAWFSSLAEPALLLGLAAVARMRGAISFAGILTGSSGLSGQGAAVTLLVTVALFVVYLAENARIPVDDPNTHLELTMIHEVMVLDHGGIDLAYIQYGASLKLWVLGGLIVSLLVPRTGQWALDTLVGVTGIVIVAAATGVVESIMARLRIARVPQLLVAAIAMSAFAFALALMTMRAGA